MISQSDKRDGLEQETGAASRPSRPTLGLGRRFALGLLCSLMLGSPLLADVLVTQEGTQVETRGAWEVRGRQVVFELPNGTFSALRLSEVDLEASREATRAVAAARRNASKPAAPQDREAVLVITNETLGQRTDASASADDEDGEGAAGGLATAGVIAVQGDVVVVDWSYDSFGEDPVYMVTGVIENRASYVAEQVSVHLDIVAVDEETGAQVPDRHILRRARVRLSSLPPGASTEFSYPVTQQDLSVHGEGGFTNPVVSFDVQFNQGETPLTDEDDEEEPATPLALVDEEDTSEASTDAGDSDSDGESDSDSDGGFTDGDGSDFLDDEGDDLSDPDDDVGDDEEPDSFDDVDSSEAGL